MHLIKITKKRLLAYLQIFINKNPFHHKTFDGAIILTKAHTLSFALAIKEQLETIGLPSVINEKFTASQNNILYFVLCPQAWKRLPASRVSIQMEQYDAKRFFTKTNMLYLQGSLLTFDFSKVNITEISKKHSFYRSTRHIIVSAPDRVPQRSDHLAQKDFDLVFYGSMNSRRREALDRLKNDFRILEITKNYGNTLHSQLSRATACLNIHHYESALFESPRIIECISIGLPVISEPSRDASEYDFLANTVNYCAMEKANIEKAISSFPISTESFKAPLNQSQKKLAAQLQDALNFISKKHKIILQNQI